MDIKVKFTEEANQFLESIPIKAYQKIVYNVLKLEHGIVDNELFKKLEGTDIWELRTLFNSIHYRLFAFWDTEEETLIIATHGIIKKTQKTPVKEITKAEPSEKNILKIKRKDNRMAKMKLTPLSEHVNKAWGEIGTPEREAMEARLEEELNAYFVGEAIKKARLQHNLTQEELGDRIGVKKSQISKLENGRCIITLPTMSRIFRALGIATASLDLGSLGKITLW